MANTSGGGDGSGEGGFKEALVAFLRMAPTAEVMAYVQAP
jgi:hypothetical protein